jgi:hypothetical protein
MQPEKVGLDRPKGTKWCDVPVPMPWTAFWLPSSGIRDSMVPNRMAWFRRWITVPDIPPLSRLLLHFEAVNFFAVVFVNGKRCGEHVGDAVPFDIDITPLVSPRHEADILVGVQDISYAEERVTGAKRIRLGRKLLYPGLPHNPGIWGAVSLRIVPELHIVGVNVRTALPERRAPGVATPRGRVEVTVAVKNETGRALGFSLTNEVYDGARQAIAFAPIRGVVGAGERTEIDMGTSWDSAALWWPEEPHLYMLRTALWSVLPAGGSPSDGVGDVVDRVHTPVGFREFRIEGDRFTLNHVPVQLRSESLCPISGALFGEMLSGAVPQPVAPEQAREVLAALKRERGLNAVRFHRMPPTAALLDAADQAGLMVVVEFPLPDDEVRYAVDHPDFWTHTEELARTWVTMHSHHPSVVMWSVDQGMVRRYGEGVVPGLRSLARSVADVDPTRPVENGADGDRVGAGELGVSSPLSLPFPNTGVAFRTAGPYEPEPVRDRVLPLAPPTAEPWVPERPADRPLCLMQHTRRTRTPNALAFFLGDAAYGSAVNQGEATAALTRLEMGACRMARLAAVHTVGRPAPPADTPDATSPVVALATRLFANFYAGTRLVEHLVLRNDTRFDQDCDLTCQFATADRGMAEHEEELLIPAGGQEEKTVAFELPDIREVNDAEGASSTLAELTVVLKGTRAGSYERRRKLAIWPHVRAAGSRRIGLYDPHGATASALSAIGAEYAALRGAPGDEFDTVLIGEGALEEGLAPDAEELRAFVEAGGLALVLAQQHVPYDLSPVPLVSDEGHAASIAFVRDAEHPVLQGLTSFEMRWWQDDHRVATGSFRKPAAGNFRCLVDAGGRGGLRWAPAVEVFHGRGSYLFSQMHLVDKAARAPVAGLLLARLADAAPSWLPATAGIVGEEERFARLGVQAATLPEDFGRDELESVQVLLLTGEALGRLSQEQLGELREMTQHGGCLYLHSLAPGQEAALEHIVEHEIELVEAPRDRLVLNRPGFGLARGLSSADLYLVDHGAWFQGELPRRIYAATTVARARGAVTGVASAVESAVEHGLVSLHAGKGRVVLDQVRWDDETGADSRAGRYAATLLTNLGVRLAPALGVTPSRRAHGIDISAACNRRLTDPIPGDAEGWTGRGPDNDLGAFSPGLLIAGGVPYRVAAAPGEADRNCCVLGGGGERSAAPVRVGRKVSALGFLVACEGHVKPGQPVAHFTLHYKSGLETQVPLRFGVDVFDWNERARLLEGATVAWKGATALGEPAALYAKRWENHRPDEPIESVVFSAGHAGATPILLALTALD